MICLTTDLHAFVFIECVFHIDHTILDFLYFFILSKRRGSEA